MARGRFPQALPVVAWSIASGIAFTSPARADFWSENVAPIGRVIVKAANDTAKAAGVVVGQSGKVIGGVLSVFGGEIRSPVFTATDPASEHGPNSVDGIIEDAKKPFELPIVPTDGPVVQNPRPPSGCAAPCESPFAKHPGEDLPEKPIEMPDVMPD